MDKVKWESRWLRVLVGLGVAMLLACVVALPGGVLAAESAQKQVTTTTSSSGDASVVTGEKAMMRLYNPNSGEHFYTANVAEKNNLKKAGWNYESVGWIAPASGGVPVYRMYNKNAGDHHYTTSAVERDNLKKAGWRYEGVGWTTPQTSSVPVYRLYNKRAKTGTHHYTTSTVERDSLKKLGWRYEGIGWYAVKDGYDVLDGWEKVKGKWQWYDEGKLAKNTWIITNRRLSSKAEPGTQRYRVDANGDLVTGFFRVNGKLYYGYKNKGHVATTSNYWYLQLEGTWYRVHSNGVLDYSEVVSRMIKKAQGYSSPTRYLLMVDIDDCKLIVFQGRKGAWRVKYIWNCATGKPSTPTVTGVFRVGAKGYSFGEDHGYSCYYWTQFYGNYLFHSRKYYPHTHKLRDSRIGKRISKGCVRLYDENAIWIQRNAAVGTTVVSIR